MYDIVASIVVFKNDEDDLRKAITCFLNTELNTYLYVVDNSPTDDLRQMCVFKNVEYIFNNNNLGFGAGNNIAIRKMMGKTKYTLIMNPDVYFEQGTLEKLFSFMEKNEGIGFVMPKVFYPDGSLQYICRLLPNPADLLLRKFNIKVLSPWVNLISKYELKFENYNKLMDVPCLPGCFMFIKTEVFEKVGIFDERFFIYFEDVDLTRRIHREYRTIYYPEASIFHGYERGSNKDLLLLKNIIYSSIKYFNKWGWFFDKGRKSINKKVLRNLKFHYNDSR